MGSETAMGFVSTSEQARRRRKLHQAPPLSRINRCQGLFSGIKGSFPIAFRQRIPSGFPQKPGSVKQLHQRHQIGPTTRAFPNFTESGAANGAPS
jgi:hypothetical protein